MSQQRMQQRAEWRCTAWGVHRVRPWLVRGAPRHEDAREEEAEAVEAHQAVHAQRRHAEHDDDEAEGDPRRRERSGACDDHPERRGGEAHESV